MIPVSVLLVHKLPFAAILRPGKVDSLFPISHFLNFDAGGWSLFIIHYDITINLILQCIIKYFFYIEKLQTQIQKITNQ